MFVWRAGHYFQIQTWEGRPLCPQPPLLLEWGHPSAVFPCCHRGVGSLISKLGLPLCPPEELSSSAHATFISYSHFPRAQANDAFLVC